MTNELIPSDPHEAAIDALLPRAEAISIVDGLFDLLDGDGLSQPDQWASAVRARMQARLAERMRQTIGVAAS